MPSYGSVLYVTMPLTVYSVGSCGLSKTIDNHLPNIRIGLVSGALNWQMNNQCSALLFSLAELNVPREEELSVANVQYPRISMQLLCFEKFSWKMRLIKYAL